MSVQYHPEEETLAEYALGALAPGMELLVASHLTYCAESRNRVARYEAMGGAALDIADPSEVSAPSLEATLAMINAPDPIETPAPQGESIFPTALQKLLPEDLDSIDWSFRLPGIYEHEMSGFGDEKVSLLKAKPGAKMLSHTHEGEEATLILAGQMKDGDKIYTKGDVAQADHDHDHRPEIIGDEMCICLIVLSGKMRFTGTIGRALNVLVR